MADYKKEEAAAAMNGTHSAHVIVNIPASPRRRVLYRVPPQLRENKKNTFEPVALPLGPYHHGRKPQFRLAEQVKNRATEILCGDMDKGFLLCKIQERVNEIRSFYGSGEGGAGDYNDEELSDMMLRDACFVLCNMDVIGPNNRKLFIVLSNVVGMSGALFVQQDVFMMENQLPFWLIKLVFSLIHGGDEKKFRELLRNYFSHCFFGDSRKVLFPWEDDGEEEEEPLHLLEAIYLITLTGVPISQKGLAREGPRSRMAATSNPTGSVRDLKAKGIHFGPSSHCLKDIRFYSSSFYGKLHLPIFLVTNNSKVFLSNMIALEMSPGDPTDLAIASYVKFMKALIENVKDVKELREKGILYNLLGSDEEVVALFHSLDTYGVCNDDLCYDVKKRIEEHCNNKTKTWMAEFLSTYFRSPWTAIALFAAIVVLSLTLIQTYYTVYPRS